MQGDYLLENIYNIEDEAYHMSGGKSSPISAIRFREINRLQSKILKEINSKRFMKKQEKPLDEDVKKNFFLMFRSNGKILSYADAYRIRKYWKVFSDMDYAANVNPKWSFYPEFLTET